MRRRSLLFKVTAQEEIKSRCKLIKVSNMYQIPNDVVKFQLFLVGGGGSGSTYQTDGSTAFSIGGKGASTFTSEEINRKASYSHIGINIGRGGSKGSNGEDTYCTIDSYTFTAAGGEGGATNYTGRPSNGQDGKVVCPFGAVEDLSTNNPLPIKADDLFGANGSDSGKGAGGKTGGGGGIFERDATFYGAGGGGRAGFLSATGKGYQGVVVIKEWYTI